MPPDSPSSSPALPRQLAALAEASLEFIGVSDLELRPVYMNPAGLRLAGLPDLAAARAVSVIDFFFPEDQARIRDDILPGVLAEGRAEIEIRLRRFDDGEARWVICSILLLTDETGAPTGFGTLTRDITDRRLAEEALRASEARLAQVFATLPVGVAVFDADGVPLMANAEMRRFLPNGLLPSQDVARRERWLVLDSDGRPLPLKRFPGVCALRGETVVPGVEARYLDDDGVETWVQFAAAPLQEPDGRTVGAVAVVVDIDALKRAQDHQTALLTELQHRVRNILAMVRSVTRRTVEAGEDLADVASHLDGRISALARTQGMLTRAAGADIDLEMLVREELLSQAADEAGLTIDGPAVLLSSGAAEVLTLTIHELATNATKYGALAQGGTISIRWVLEPHPGGPDWLRFHWIERGLRILSNGPRPRGFGTDLIESRVAYELDGEGRLDFEPGGIHAEFAFPLAASSSDFAPSPATFAQPSRL